MLCLKFHSKTLGLEVEGVGLGVHPPLIFTFPLFQNHLRPENFPMDTVIFTGKMTLAGSREEPHAEYACLAEEGRLEEMLTDPPSPFAPRLSFWFVEITESAK